MSFLKIMKKNKECPYVKPYQNPEEATVECMSRWRDPMKESQVALISNTTIIPNNKIV